MGGRGRIIASESSDDYSSDDPTGNLDMESHQFPQGIPSVLFIILTI